MKPLSKTSFRGERFLKAFEDDCRIRGMSEESTRSYLSNLKIFLGFVENRLQEDLLDVDRFDLREFIRYLQEERKVSLKRIENYFSTLASFYDFLEYEGLTSGNPVRAVRKRYLRKPKKKERSYKAKVISEEEMGDFLNSIMDVREKAMATLLVKTGIRRGELQTIDLRDIDWEVMSIRLKDKRKRSNNIVYFDDETAAVLRRWFMAREKLGDGEALFPGRSRAYIDRNSIYYAVAKWARRFGIHDPSSGSREDHFSPHNLRHCFTTYMRRAGMSREFIQELRGDVRKDAIDIYDRIDPEELRREYLARVPKFGIF